MRTALPGPAPACAGLLLVALAVAAGSAGAATIPVAPPGTIADGLALAAYGDTVLVACGTYQEQGLVMPDGVVLRAESGVPGCVTVAGLGGEPILVCSAVDSTTAIEGLTFALSDVGFPLPVPRGGGALCTAGADVRFRDCRFVGLGAGYGGAVHVADAKAGFDRCAFRDNQALVCGGAVNAVGTAEVRLVACLATGNGAGNVGAAFNAAHGALVQVQGCTVAGQADGLGVLSTWNATAADVDRSILAANAGAAWGGDAQSVLAVDCTDIWGNAADWTGPLADLLAAGDGNLEADPAFCGALAPAHPWGLDASSPCADAAGCGLIGAEAVACDSGTGIDDPPGDPAPDLPDATRLLGSRPNPFNPSTAVVFALRRPGRVTITVYDLAGRAVRRLTDAAWPAGVHEVAWRGDDATGRRVAAGVYFVRLAADGIFDTRRVALVK